LQIRKTATLEESPAMSLKMCFGFITFPSCGIPQRSKSSSSELEQVHLSRRSCILLPPAAKRNLVLFCSSKLFSTGLLYFF